MLLNKFNLSISKHCTSEPIAGNATDVIGDDTIEVDPTVLPQHEGKFPVHPRFLDAKPVIFEIAIDTRSLLQLAQAAKDFEGGHLRLQFTGENDPVRLDTRNPMTGQTWEALMMPRLRK